MSGFVAPLAAAHAIQSIGMIAIVLAIAAWLFAGSARLRWIGGVAVLALAPLVLAGR